MLKIIPLLFVIWSISAAENPEDETTKAKHEFVCKVRGHQACYNTGTMCAQFAPSAQTSLGCFNSFLDCLNRAMENCENLTEDIRQFIEKSIHNE